MGRNKYGISGDFDIFAFLKSAFEVHFFLGLNFYTLSETLDNMYGHVAQIFF